ncbi:MFS transporter [Candidatus Aerophobetes bacterium]|uniref:MFS transporter n=1 Tax=Aerophobetes bacterium TaxID=2030807 RepID=A0A523ZJC1_UNCAE|nr:MAG: MFS transporter [Candidatus Aerophobetes bacterium]
MPEKLSKKNFILGVLNGAIFRLGLSFTDPHTVLPLFVSLLTSSKVLIGSVITIRAFGWFMPQVFIASFTEHWQKRKPIYILGAVLRASSLFILFLFIYFWEKKMSSLLLVSFFVLYGTACLGAGLGGLPFLDIIGKVITPRHRGKFFSLRLFFGGILAVGGGLLVRYVLAHPIHFPFPHNYALLFFLTFLFTSLGMLLFVFIREPAELPALKQRSSFFVYLKRIGIILRDDKNYSRLFWAIIFLNCGIIALPFYAVYGREVLHFPSETTGVFVAAQMMGAIISALFWGFFSDRYGNKIVVVLAGLVGLSIPCLVILTIILYKMAIFPELLLTIYTIVFVLVGMNLNGLFIGQNNLLLEIAPAGERATYIGVANTAIGLVSLLSLLGGYIIERTSYTVLFFLSLILVLTGIFLAFSIVEPRNRESRPSSHNLKQSS